MKKAFIILAGVLLLSGCSDTGGLSDMPDSEPWNKSVMETDNGYYINENHVMFMHYFDKGTGANVFLCPKPQCSHDGSEECPATCGYLRVCDSVLYDGNIYILSSSGKNDRVTLSLYKATLDGTYLDKVADVFSIDNSADADYSVNASLCVHKGCAYASYSLGMGEDHSGITCINLKNARTESLLSSDEFKNGGVSGNKCVGHGDYVYFDFTDNGEYFIYRRDTKSGEITPFRDGTLAGCAFSGGNMYRASTYGFEVFGLDDGKMKDEIFVDGDNSDFLIYDGMIFLRDSESPAIAVWSLSGEKLGSIGFMCGDVKSYYSLFEGFGENDESAGYFRSLAGISDGKLYIRLNADSHDEDYLALSGKVYCCDISDIIDGTGKWTFAYDINSLATAVNFEEAYAAIFGG